MKGLLLAGGHGTRLRPLTFTGNKHMLPLANKPMILYGLEHLINAGIKEIGVILGPIKEGVINLLGDGSKFGVNITYINQPEPRGLAHAVLISEEFLQGEPFVMYLGDNLLKQGARPLVDVFRENGSDCVIAVAKVKDPTRYGVVVFNKNKSVEKLVEKPKEFVSDWALVGVYVFNEKVFDAVKNLKPSWRNELEITDAIQTMLSDGAKVNVQFVNGWWKDTGKPEDLLEVNQLILRDLKPFNEGIVEGGVSITNVVSIGSGTVIRKDSAIRGPVTIGRNCEVGANTYIGPYTSIGDDVKLKDCEIENSIVMEGAYIGCAKRIVDSLIGRNARVVDSRKNLPRGHKLILGDVTYVSI